MLVITGDYEAHLSRLNQISMAKSCIVHTKIVAWCTSATSYIKHVDKHGTERASADRFHHSNTL